MSQLVGVDVTQVYTAAQYKRGDAPGPAGMLHTAPNGKRYKLVLYDSGAGPVAAVAGNVCYYYLAAGYALHKVTSDLSDSVNLGAGVLQSAPADGEYCWIQIRGPATVTTALTAGADGNALTAVGATDGTLDVSALVTDAVVAFADDISEKQIVCMFPE